MMRMKKIRKEKRFSMLENDLLIEVNQKFFRLHDHLEKYQKAKDAFESCSQAIRDKSDTYQQEYIEQQTQDAKSDFRALRESTFERFLELSGDLIDKLIEVDTRAIEPERVQAIRDAVDLIKSGALNYEAANQLNQAFEGDQQALKALKRVYTDANVSAGQIDDLINPHDLDLLPEKLRDLGWGAILGDGSVNRVGQFIGELANCYAVKKYDWVFDPDAFVKAMRVGAGLPEEKPE